MNLFADMHVLIGTDACLRMKDGDGCDCCNDHTGCMWNDGHNTCMHNSKPPKNNGEYDCPLRKIERTCLRCKKNGYRSDGFRKLGTEHICSDCWWTCKVKYA
jgi:hypothetical protein